MFIYRGKSLCKNLYILAYHVWIVQFTKGKYMSQKTLEKKLLLVIKLTDGCWVLVPKEAHEPKQDYKNEARGVLVGLMMRMQRSRRHSLKDEACDIMTDIVGFRRPNDMDSLKPFKEDGIEWHPVVLRLDVYVVFNSEFLSHIKKTNKDVQIIPLDEHKYADKLRLRLK